MLKMLTQFFFLKMFMDTFVEQIIALTEALEELPVIRKLDLRGNEAMGVEVSSAMSSKPR